MIRTFMGADNPDLAQTLVEHGQGLAATGRFADAEQAFLEARTVFVAAFSERHVSVANCLRDLGDEDLAGVARRRLADEDPGVRLAALSAATRCPPGAPADLGEEISRLVGEDPDPGVRRAAAVALSRLADPPAQARQVLEGAARSTDEAMVRAARAGLARLDAAERPN